jgi:oxalate---CoA ligase
MLVQQPTVIVGILPEGTHTEVFIASQPSKKRKAKEAGASYEPEPIAASQLQIIPDARSQPLQQLRGEYGDILRVAANPDATFSALTGSHIRARIRYILEPSLYLTFVV